MLPQLVDQAVLIKVARRPLSGGSLRMTNLLFRKSFAKEHTPSTMLNISSDKICPSPLLRNELSISSLGCISQYRICPSLPEARAHTVTFIQSHTTKLLRKQYCGHSRRCASRIAEQVNLWCVATTFPCPFLPANASHSPQTLSSPTLIPTYIPEVHG